MSSPCFFQENFVDVWCLKPVGIAVKVCYAFCLKVEGKGIFIRSENT